MSVRVKLATEPEEIRTLMTIRHQVFVEQHSDLLPPGGMIVDLFDALKTTSHFVALVHGKIIGGVRITEDSLAGMPSDEFFDVREALPNGARPATCSMLCLRPAPVPEPRLVQGMLRMCVSWAAARGLTYLCAMVPPGHAPALQQIGFDRVGQPFVDAKGLTNLSMVLDLSANAHEYVRFVRRDDAKLWLDCAQRAFFEEGDIIVQRGESGDEAYIVMAGRADVLAYGAEPGGPIVRSFGPDELFGELALLTDRSRSATVVAAEPVELMVLSRGEFQRQMSEHPSLCVALLRAIGDRFHETIVVLNETEDLNRAGLPDAPASAGDEDAEADGAVDDEATEVDRTDSPEPARD